MYCVTPDTTSLSAPLIFAHKGGSARYSIQIKLRVLLINSARKLPSKSSEIPPIPFSARRSPAQPSRPHLRCDNKARRQSLFGVTFSPLKEMNGKSLSFSPKWKEWGKRSDLSKDARWICILRKRVFQGGKYVRDAVRCGSPERIGRAKRDWGT